MNHAYELCVFFLDPAQLFVTLNRGDSFKIDVRSCNLVDQNRNFLFIGTIYFTLTYMVGIQNLMLKAL